MNDNAILYYHRDGDEIVIDAHIEHDELAEVIVGLVARLPEAQARDVAARLQEWVDNDGRIGFDPFTIAGAVASPEEFGTTLDEDAE